MTSNKCPHPPRFGAQTGDQQYSSSSKQLETSAMKTTTVLSNNFLEDDLSTKTTKTQKVVLRHILHRSNYRCRKELGVW